MHMYFFFFWKIVWMFHLAFIRKHLKNIYENLSSLKLQPTSQYSNQYSFWLVFKRIFITAIKNFGFKYFIENFKWIPLFPVQYENVSPFYTLTQSLRNAISLELLLRSPKRLQTLRNNAPYYFVSASITPRWVKMSLIDNCFSPMLF